MSKLHICLLSLPLLWVSFVAFANNDPDMILNIGEPAEGQSYSGVANLRGWAIAKAELNRIELYMDGNLLYNIPFGGTRKDVERQYPGYPNSANSGFAMAFNYSNYAIGPHSITIRAYDTNENFIEKTVNFNIVRFTNPFVTTGIGIDYTAGITIGENNEIHIARMWVFDKHYSVTLRWRKATQGFAIEEITPVP